MSTNGFYRQYAIQFSKNKNNVNNVKPLYFFIDGISRYMCNIL